jgi:hypothetical protein
MIGPLRKTARGEGSSADKICELDVDEVVYDPYPSAPTRPLAAVILSARFIPLILPRCLDLRIRQLRKFAVRNNPSSISPPD